MSNEINKSIELSEDELDVIAGGLSVIAQDNLNQFTQKQNLFQQVSHAGPDGAFSASNIAILNISSLSNQKTVTA
ncbi:CTB family bacteriocin [Calothrix sp. NIES-2098]|uniref:CTB family bacteriocin n=1 Tax=Calothrix sp. NIES-2098 TaxID=1954171 RepID=UPI000B5F1C64|nr:hypothetical protein NIES2098_23150 [Calothrix sp. NIES-2098]